MKALRRVISDFTQETLDRLLQDHSLFPYVKYHLALDSPSEKYTLAHSKRLRGVLCLAIAESVSAPRALVLPVACSIELCHNASLLLDDIQDQTEERCGRPALWRHADISVAENTACLLLLTSELVLLERQDPDGYYRDARLRLSRTGIAMADGQTKDLCSRDHWARGIDYYVDVVLRKTGGLLGTAAFLGARSTLSEPESRLFDEFGRELGLRHQIEDDVDDLVAVHAGGCLPLDAGNVAHFLLGRQVSSPDPSSYIRDDPDLWQSVLQARSFATDRLSRALDQLRLFNPKVHAMLSAISSALVDRNTSEIDRLLLNSGTEKSRRKDRAS